MATFGKVIRSAAVIAALTATSAFGASNIAATKHNLSFSNPITGAIKAASGDNNDEICVYCHTPHAANTAFVGAPLWNKASPTTTGFTMYTSATVKGTIDSTPNNPSMACLSCHDGVSAINSMINMPGSGGYNSTGTNTKFGATAEGAAFVMPAAGITNIGKDLSNDHPVSIVYSTATTNRPASLRDTTYTLVGTWAGATDVASLLRNGKVECGSCHDPHEGNNATFLRTANGASALCVGCHAK